LVGTDALEHTGPVVQRVGEDVDLRVLPVDELAVHPDLVHRRERHPFLLRVTGRPRTASPSRAESIPGGPLPDAEGRPGASGPTHKGGQFAGSGASAMNRQPVGTQPSSRPPWTWYRRSKPCSGTPSTWPHMTLRTSTPRWRKTSNGSPSRVSPNGSVGENCR